MSRDLQAGSMRAAETVCTDTAEAVQTTSPSDDRTGKVPGRGAPTSGSRFDMRAETAQLARWRAFAKSERVSLSDLVRVAVEHVMRSQPTGWARSELRRDLDGLIEQTRARFRGGCTDVALHGEVAVKSSGTAADIDQECTP